MAIQRFTSSHALRVVLALGWADFLLKYRGSFLGFLWSFAVPLVKFLVIFHVIGPFVQTVPYYHLYLFLGIILWEYFSLLTGACMTMVFEKAVIIQKVLFPRVLLIFSVGWTHTLIFGTYLTIFLIAALLFRIPPTWGFVYLMVTFMQITLFALGIGMLLSSYVLKFRDLQHLWWVLLQVMFWLTPIVYPYTPTATVTQDMRGIFSGSWHLSLWSLFDIFIRFQPLSIILYDARRAVLYPASIGIPSFVHTIAVTLFCVGVFLLGARIFRRRSAYFLQEY